MGRKKTALERKLEESIKAVKRGEFPKLSERLRRRDKANMPDALAGDEAFRDQDVD